MALRNFIEINVSHQIEEDDANAIAAENKIDVMKEEMMFNVFVQIGVLEAEFDRCRKQLFSELQKTHDRIADLDKEVDKKSGIIVSLKRKIAMDIARKKDQLSALKLEYSEKDGENIRLRKEMLTLYECKDQLVGEIKNANDRIAVLNKEVKKKSDIIVDLKREISEQKDTFAENIASKEEKLRILSIELNEKHEINNVLKKENDTLQENYKKEIKYLQNLNVEHKKNIERLNDHIKKMNIDMKNVSCKHRKETEQLEYDLNETRHAFTCKENEIKVRSTELEYQIDTLETEKRKLGEIVETLNTEVKTLKSTQKQLEKRKADNANENVEDKTFERLNKTCQTDWTYDNPRLSYLTRPTKIAEDYAELYDNEWTDLFDDIELATEEENISFILHILMKTSAICSDLSNCHKKRIQDAFCKLTSTSQIKRFDPNKEEDIHSEEEETGSTAVEFEKDFGLVTKEEILIESDFGLLQKSQKESIFDVKNFFETKLSKEVETTLTKLIIGESRELKIKRQDGLERYIAKCVNTCWLMCQHDPPLFLEFSDIKESTPFDTNKYKPYISSGKFIDFIVMPAVYLHEKGP
ncbi:hyaluronan mediated motility receptor-like, partial [Ruditapes philippinarum]|uniref:hyaluronan mediated motility receptor-like n=1 Tax=Ruditapes philippinarum TaxID=129788 RepID=UPI00295B9CFA